MKLVEKAEAFVIYVLIGMLLVAVILGTVELGRLLVHTILEPPLLLIRPEELFDSFGQFLVILIGLELLKILKLHVLHRQLRPEIVIEVAIIAVCNKVITLDIKTLPAETLLGMGALLLALSAGYYVFYKARSERD